MAEEINGILIKELPEASQSQLTDPTDIIVEDATTTRRSKLSTLANWLKQKLGIGTAANLTTSSKEIVGAVNELNTNMLAILSGESASFDIPAGKHTDITIQFQKTFSSIPVVCVNTQGSGYSFIPVIHNIRTQSVVIRAVNPGNTAITGRKVHILAVGKLAQ